jgi:uncharacterized protein YodC (DUF2158 family)
MFEVGDIVCLKSNPEVPMTVSMVVDMSGESGFSSRLLKEQMRLLGYADGDVQCTWFDGPAIMTDFFKTVMLVKKSEPFITFMFEAGDVVYLKSNPEVLMTVSVVINTAGTYGFRPKLKKRMRLLGYANGDVQCRWFRSDGPEVMTEFFKATMLAKKS